jgi:hypothetical protein
VRVCAWRYEPFGVPEQILTDTKTSTINRRHQPAGSAAYDDLARAG